MNRRTWIPALAVAALTLVAPAQAGAQGAAMFDPAKLVTPPLHPIPAVHPERYTLPNGAVIYLLESHDLPTVRGTAFFPASPTWVNADRAGLDDLVGEAMRSGGSAKHGGDWLDDRLAAIGAEISTDLGQDMASGSFHCLSDNTSEVVKLMAEVLRDPAFPADKIELAKVDLRRQIASRNDEMLQLLVRTARIAVNGKDSPYSRVPEYATVEPINHADCAALQKKVFVPNRMILAVFGDFRSADMKALLQTAFGDWPKSDSPAPPPPPEPPVTTRHVVFAPKEDVTQSGIVLTHRGFLNKDPDVADMDVLETALGGGFQSRLVNRIRTQRGLAYATGAFSGGDYVRPAAFAAYALTKSESTMVALDLLRGEVVRVTQAPFTDAELATAKQSVENSLVFRFERPEQVLFRAAYYELVGYPSDYLQTYQNALHGVTAASVFEAAKRKIHPDQLVSVIVGKESDFDRKLDSLEETVERVDLTIPPPPSKFKAGAATPEALARGREWLVKAAQLAGGSAAWSKVKTVSIDSKNTVTVEAQTIHLDTALQWDLSGRWLMTRKLPFGEVQQGFDGKAGWMSGMGQVQDQPKLADDLARQFERSLFHLFSDPSRVNVQALEEPQKVDGVSYRAALVTSDRVKEWVLLFAADGQLAGMEYQDEGPQGPARSLERYSDWQSEGGISYPRARLVTMDGRPFLEATVTSVKLNVTLGDALFKRPAAPAAPAKP
ncbi:MAG: M16 family metallopeptidase [Candidatus Eiseniibacteriota bacterium]